MKNRYALGAILALVVTLVATAAVFSGTRLGHWGPLCFFICPLIAVTFALLALRRHEDKRLAVPALVIGAAYALLVIFGSFTELSSSVPPPSSCYLSAGFTCADEALTRLSTGAEVVLTLQNTQAVPADFTGSYAVVNAEPYVLEPTTCPVVPVVLAPGETMVFRCFLEGDFPQRGSGVKVLLGLTYRLPGGVEDMALPISVTAPLQ